MRKTFFAVLFVGLCCWLQAQTIASVTFADGSAHEYTIQASGGFYFDSATLILRESPIAPEERFSVDDISRITFSRPSVQSIDETTQGDIRLFPNPASQQVAIELPDEEIHQLSIFSIDGRLMGKHNVRNGQTIDISSLPLGLYILRTEQHITKLIKR